MNVTELTFSAITGMADAVASAVAETPAGMRPRLGALSLIRWKPTRWGVAITPSQGSSTGKIKVMLFAGTTELQSMELELVAGGEPVSAAQDVDLAPVLGDTPLSVRFDVLEETASAGVSVTVHSRLEIQQPGSAGGCQS